MGAMTAGAAATGMRAYLAASAPRWLTPARLRTTTIVLLGAALLLASSVLSGSS